MDRLPGGDIMHNPVDTTACGGWHHRGQPRPTAATALEWLWVSARVTARGVIFTPMARATVREWLNDRNRAAAREWLNDSSWIAVRRMLLMMISCLLDR